jgi:FkbM family methyltransferase
VLIPLARISGTRSIVAYEPSPRNFRLLGMNLALNEIEGVVAINTALGSRAGEIQFTENSINTGNSRVAPSDGEITVPLDTLDRTVPRIGRRSTSS